MAPVHHQVRGRRQSGAAGPAPAGAGLAQPRYHRARAGCRSRHRRTVPRADHQGKDRRQGAAARPVQDCRHRQPAGRRDSLAGQGVTPGAGRQSVCCAGQPALPRTEVGGRVRQLPRAGRTPVASSRPVTPAAPARGTAPRWCTERSAGAPPGGARASRPSGRASRSRCSRISAFELLSEAHARSNRLSDPTSGSTVTFSTRSANSACAKPLSTRAAGTRDDDPRRRACGY